MSYLYDMITERDELRYICVTRQENLCVVCGRGLYGDAEVHEAILKRGDLPGDPRVFNQVNCVALHKLCHENTRQVDVACIRYLTDHYGLGMVIAYLEHLELKTLPGRAQEIVLSARDIKGLTK